MPWRLPWLTVRMSHSTTMEKITGDKMHPCLTPVSTLKGSVSQLLCMIQHSKFLYKDWVMFTNFSGTTCCRRIFESDGPCRLSKIFLKSTNTTYKELFIHVNDLTEKKEISMHDFPFLKPVVDHCCSRLSTVVVMHRRRWQKTLLVMDSSVMPLQLLHSDRFPVLGSLMIVPLFQASGITSLSKMPLRMR